MQRFAWLVTPSWSSIAFALRLCAAMAAALYLAMWLQLDRPYWSSLEVVVMIQPVPGMAVARGFARAAGTVIAGCAGLTIMALFAQSYELSAAALACWVALCAFGANLLRDNLAYGFSIAGFIAGVTVVLSHATNQPPFDVAIARMQECLLAAICVMVVNVLLSPSSGARAYLAGRLALLRSLGAELARLAGPAPPAGETVSAEAAVTHDAADEDPHAVLRQLAVQAAALEQTRQYVSFDSPGFARFSRLARRLDYDLLALISAVSSLHIYIARRPGRLDLRPLAALAEPARRMRRDPRDAEAVKQAFDDAHERILATARAVPAVGSARGLADWVVLSRALDIAGRARAAIVKHGLLIDERAHRREDLARRSEFDRPIDVKHAARNALRSLVAVGLGGVVWVNFHDQLPSVLLMILLAALTTIFATLPNPVAAGVGFAQGFVVAACVAFVVDFIVLPQVNSYAMLMLAMLPAVFIAGLAMTNPDTALPGRISAVMFSLLVHVQNGVLPTFTTYIQIVMGISGAIGITILAFRLILPVTPRKRLREQMMGVFEELAAGRRYSRERFETRMYDRLNTLALGEIDEPVRFSARDAVLAMINLGLEARTSIVLVERVVDFPEETRVALGREMRRLRDLFAGRQPDLAEIVRIQHAVHGLAQRMLAIAVDIEHVARRRPAIRAGVAAELVASALADYALAYRTTEREHVRLGDIDAASG